MTMSTSSAALVVLISTSKMIRCLSSSERIKIFSMKKERLFYTVYVIESKITGEFSFGQHATDDLDDKYFGSGKRICALVSKYGAVNFRRTILFIYETLREALRKEIELISSNLNNPLCLNSSISFSKKVEVADVLGLLSSTNLSLGEIGDKLGITGERIRQIADEVGINANGRRKKRKLIYNQPVLRLCYNCFRSMKVKNKDSVFCSTRCASNYTWFFHNRTILTS